MLHAKRACGSTWRKPRGDWKEKNTKSRVLLYAGEFRSPSNFMAAGQFLDKMAKILNVAAELWLRQDKPNIQWSRTPSPA
jgi:hypothetical protein